jgi:hypothetical protein
MTATVTDVDRTWTSADLTGRWPGHSHRPRVVLHRLRRHLGYATVGSGRPQLWTVPEIAAVATYHDNPADLAAIILTCPAAMVVPLDSVWRTIP